MTHTAPQFLALARGHQSEPGDGQCPHPDISSSLSSPEEELWWGWGHSAAGPGSHLVFLPASPWCRTREEVPEAPAWSGPWQCVPTEVLVPTPGGSGTSPTPQPVCPTPSISYGQGWVIFSVFYPFDPLHSDIPSRGVMGRRCRRPHEGALLLPPSSCPLSPSVPCPLLRSVTCDYLRTTIPHPISSSQTPHADLSPSPIIEASLACPSTLFIITSLQEQEVKKKGRKGLYMNTGWRRVSSHLAAVPSTSNMGTSLTGTSHCLPTPSLPPGQVGWHRDASHPGQPNTTLHGLWPMRNATDALRPAYAGKHAEISGFEGGDPT